MRKSKIIPLNATREAFQRIDYIRTSPKSSGNSFLAKHLNNERLTRNKAIFAKCADCMGFYVDGRVDCKIPLCPLYPFMPYREKGETITAHETEDMNRSDPGRCHENLPGCNIV